MAILCFFYLFPINHNFFDIYDVAESINEKLIRRHPHIFGDVSVENSEEVLVNWEEIKKKEKAHKHRESVLDGIPKTMPPLERAFKVQNKIKKFDFEPKTKEESLLRVEKTFEELKNSLDFDKEKMKKEYGKLLFSLVNLGKIMDIEPYEELRKVNKEVEEEFRKHENMYIDKNKNEK
jgi:MazG family protein